MSGKRTLWRILLAAAISVGLSPTVPANAAPDLSQAASLRSVERTSPDVVDKGDEVSFAWTSVGTQPTSVSFEIVDPAGTSRYALWSDNSASSAAGTTDIVTDESWPSGEYTVEAVSVHWANGSLRYGREGSIDPYPQSLVFETPAPTNLANLSFRVDGQDDSNLGRASALTSFSIQRGQLQAGDTVSFAWTTSNRPATQIRVELEDPTGLSRYANWTGDASNTGRAEVVTDNSWIPGNYTTSEITVRWANGVVTYTPDGQLRADPSTMSTDGSAPVSFSALRFGLANPSMAGATPKAPTLAFFARSSAAVQRPGGLIAYEWRVAATLATTVRMELLDPLGRSHYLYSAGGSAPRASGIIEAPVNLSRWPIGVYSVQEVVVHSLNGTVRYGPGSAVVSDPPSLIGVPTPDVKFQTTTIEDFSELTEVSEPSIEGTLSVGSVLTTNPGAWEPQPVRFSYQWLRDGQPISNATRSTYTLTPSDAGLTVSVRVSSIKAGYNSQTGESPDTGIVEGGVLTVGYPSITGERNVGDIVTAVPGNWGRQPVSLAYQWNRNGEPIVGATAQTYVLAADDAGSPISVTVVGSKPGFTTASRTSTTIGVYRQLDPPPIPRVSGSAQVGESVRADPGVWQPSPVQLTYQWLRDGAPISGATDRVYSVIATDSGRTLSVQVSGSKAGYTTKATASEAVAVE